MFEKNVQTWCFGDVDVLFKSNSWQQNPCISFKNHVGFDGKIHL